MKLRLPNQLRIALMGSLTAVMTLATGAWADTAVTVYKQPAFGGTVWTWNPATGLYEADGKTPTATPARENSMGPVYNYNSDNISVIETSSVDTSDSGGVKISGASSVTTSLGSWAGSIYVGAGSALSVSYNTSLKGTEGDGYATVYVDGVLTVTERTLFDMNDGKDQKWYIGENGVINTNFSTISKGTLTWSLQVVENSADTTAIENVKNRSLTDVEVSRTFITAGADLLSGDSPMLDSLQIFDTSGVLLWDSAETYADGYKYTVTSSTAGITLSYTKKGYKAIALTTTGDVTWVNGGAADGQTWTYDNTATSFINGDSVTVSGGAKATLGGNVTAGAITLGASSTTGSVELNGYTLTSTGGIALNGSTISDTTGTGKLAFAAGSSITSSGTSSISAQTELSAYNGGAVNITDGELSISANGRYGALSMAAGTKLDITDKATVTFGLNAGSIGAADKKSWYDSGTRTINVTSGSTLTDYGYYKLTGSTLTVEGGGTLNIYGISLSADQAYKSTLNVNADTTLNIIGTSNDSSGGNLASFGLAHWNASNQVNVYGTLAMNCALVNISSTSTPTISVKEGGTLTMAMGLAHLKRWSNSASSKIDVEKGGTLNIGGTWQSSNNSGTLTVALADGSTITANEDGTTTDQAFTIASDATINLVAGTGKSLEVKSSLADASGITTSGTITLSGEVGGSIEVKSGTLTLTSGKAINDTVSIAEGGTLSLGSEITLSKAIANSGTIAAADGGTIITISDLSNLTKSNYSDLSDTKNGYYTKADATVVTGNTELSNITWKQGDTELSYSEGKVGVALTGGLYYVNEGDVSISGANGATGYQMAANTTLTFTGDTTVSGDITTTGGDNSTRAITVNEDVTVQAANITNSWGWAKLDVDGTLNVTGTLNLAYIKGDLGTKNNYVTGDGSITAATLVAGNWGKYLVDVKTLAATTVTMQESATMQIDSASATIDTVNANVGTLSFTGDAATVNTKIYSNGAGTITVGDGTNKTVLTTARIELGDNGSSGNDSTLNVKAGSVLKVTGSDADSGDIYKNTGLILGEWESATTANVDGTFLSQSASLQPGDTGFTLNIGNGGVMAVRGIGTWGCNKSGKTQTQAINLNGGKLVLGENALNGKHNSAMTLTLAGGTIGTYYSNTTEGAADISIGVNATLSKSTTTTLEANLYTVDFTNNTVTAGSTAADIAVSGVISGEGALKVTGAGTVTLSGANTYTGITTVDGSTLKVGNADAIGSGEVRVTGTSTLAKTDDVEQVNIKGKLRVGYWNSDSDKASNATATLADKTSVGGDMDVVMSSTAVVNDTLTIADKKTLNVGVGSHLQVKSSADDATTLVDLTGKSGNQGTYITGGTSISYVAANGDDATAEGYEAAHGLIKGGVIDNAVMALAEASSLKLTDVTLQNTIITGTAAPMVAATNITFNGGSVTMGTVKDATSGTYNHDGKLTASNVTVSADSTLNADLSVSGAMTFGGVLDMGCEVNFTGATTITLSDSMAADVWKNGKTAVLTSVESYDGLAYTNFNGKALEAVSDGEGTGTYTIYAMVPEPATTTLSLLALAGLCARRRRR